MSQLRIYAPFRGPEGYSILARDLVVQLHRAGVHILLEEFEHWGPYHVELTSEQHVALGEGLSNQPYRQAGPIPYLNICLPEQVRTRDDHRNCIYTMFEADGIPENWDEALENVDEVYVPTDYNKWSFTHRSHLPVGKVHVLPIGYDSDRYNVQVDPLPLRTTCGRSLEEFEYRFLIVCEVTDRKNFWGALHTYLTIASELGPGRCCAILKVSRYSGPATLDHEIRGFQERLMADGTIPRLPYNLFAYKPILGDDVHANFIRTGTHYLSTSLGEGWDLTAMQAAACGLHVMVPYHSAYQCWLNPDDVLFFPITKKLPATQAGSTARLYRGSNWTAWDMPASVDMLVSNLLDPTLMNLRLARLKTSILQYSWKTVLPKYLSAFGL